jgi:hypothetical protein
LLFVGAIGRATTFYRETSGLTLAHEDEFAAVFSIGGATLRVSTVADFVPHQHTILGFRVEDVSTTVKALRETGAVFNVYIDFNQDEFGVWTAPSGSVRVAWFNNRDGKVLSITIV